MPSYIKGKGELVNRQKPDWMADIIRESFVYELSRMTYDRAITPRPIRSDLRCFPENSMVRRMPAKITEAKFLLPTQHEPKVQTIFRQRGHQPDKIETFDGLYLLEIIGAGGRNRTDTEPSPTGF